MPIEQTCKIVVASEFIQAYSLVMANAREILDQLQPGASFAEMMEALRGSDVTEGYVSSEMGPGETA